MTGTVIFREPYFKLGGRTVSSKVRNVALSRRRVVATFDPFGPLDAWLFARIGKRIALRVRSLRAPTSRYNPEFRARVWLTSFDPLGMVVEFSVDGPITRSVT